MTTYENAPATKLVATHCAMCSRPLVDADSLEKGIGPVCAKRTDYGHPTNEPDTVRAVTALAGTGVTVDLADAHKACNQLVYLIAADPKNANVPALCAAIEALGYVKVARVIAKRLAPAYVTVKTEGTSFVVKLTVAFGSPVFDSVVTAFRKVPGGAYNKANKSNSFPLTSKGDLWTALKSALPKGSVVDGTKLVIL